jgi:hypothetical protein
VPVHPVERKLAAIFAADIAGYSRLMARDEVCTLARLKACRAIVDELIVSHRGRIFNTAGDSVVADFASVVDAVQCAVAVQAAIATENAGGSAAEPMQFRIGAHVGDVMVEGENLLGDGVNIAARLESLAEPGGIRVSAVVRDHVGNKLPPAFDDLGEQHGGPGVVGDGGGDPGISQLEEQCPTGSQKEDGFPVHSPCIDAGPKTPAAGETALALTSSSCSSRAMSVAIPKSSCSGHPSP